jgi:hypothetical protein
MIAEKFLLLLETLLSRVVDDKPSTVISIPAAFPNSPNPLTSAVTPPRRQMISLAETL